MFESPTVDDLDLTSCSDALVASVTARRQQEASRLAIVAHWADLHAVTCPAGRWGASTLPDIREGDHPEPAVEEASRRAGLRLRHHQPGSKAAGRGVQIGADGTPRVAEFAVTELGVLLEVGTTAATNLLRDALELRHRLSPVWKGVMTGQIEAWQARKSAGLTRALTLEQAQAIGEEVAGALATLPFSRAVTVIEAAVVAADPEAHHARLREQANRRYVAAGRAEALTELRTLIMHGTREEVARVEGMVQQLADALAELGDTDPVQSRRVKALVLMAHPARACLTLARAYPPPDGTIIPDHEPDEEQAEEPSPQGSAVLVGRMLAEGCSDVLDRLRPRTVLYLHLAEDGLLGAPHGRPPGEPGQVARVRDLGPATLEEVRRWVEHDHLVVRPVIDVANMTPVDAYEVPAAMRNALQLREPFEVFPFGSAPAHRCDQDHTIPYTPVEEGGQPGQTHPGNLGPLSRRHHRAKTFGGFVCHQPLPGLYLWRTPSGHWYRRDHVGGSQHLGRQTPDIIRQAERPPTSPVEYAFLNALLEVS